MKTIIMIVVAFVLWVLAWGYRWVQQTQTKLIELSTELYESWLQSANVSGTVSNELKAAAQAEIDKQVEQFQAQAKTEASNYIKSQIDEIFK